MLTDEEKRRIEAEEEYRAEMRARHSLPERQRKAQDVNTREDRIKQARRDSNRLGFFIIAGFVLFVVFFARYL